MLWNNFNAVDVAQQSEHDRKVATAAVAAARLEWERQLQQQQLQSGLKQSKPHSAPIQAPTIVNTGMFNDRKIYWK